MHSLPHDKIPIFFFREHGPPPKFATKPLLRQLSSDVTSTQPTFTEKLSCLGQLEREGNDREGWLELNMGKMNYYLFPTRAFNI